MSVFLLTRQKLKALQQAAMVLRCCSPHSSQSLDAVLCILHSVQNTVSTIHCTSVLHKLPRGGRAVERGSMRMGGTELCRRRAGPQPFLNAVVVRWWQRQGPQGCCQGCSHLACLGSGCCSTRSQDIERRGAAKWPTRLDKKRKTGRPSAVPPHTANRLQTPSERSNDSLGLGEPWRVSHPQRVHSQKRGRGPNPARKRLAAC